MNMLQKFIIIIDFYPNHVVQRERTNSYFWYRVTPKIAAECNKMASKMLHVTNDGNGMFIVNLIF